MIEDQPIENTVITIEHEAPLFSSLTDAAEFYKGQGSYLARALWNALPGGTMDALIAELLSRRASLFRVSFANENGEK